MKLFKIAIWGITILNTSCGFHQFSKQSVPLELQKITFDARDPYGSLARSIREQLRINGIAIVNPEMIEHRHNLYLISPTNNRTKNREDITLSNLDKLPCLRIIDNSNEEETVSILKNGKTAEYRIMLNISAQLLTHGYGSYSFNIHIYRSFFDNPLTILAKDFEHEMLNEEIRSQAAQELVHKIMLIHLTKLQNNNITINKKN
ncbi:LPS-assembly lipoprotein LptE [Candidatus Profftia lariciata]|uniref:LPS assembly lipoprotein LptE n=1 Tax=Candidatus Profftia lariciata TaxID=1987921 RepID=UPI001D013D22|nr:LPS assembly lipoprotein LptE [Candidatus Profftia lariciata]UDG81599.1 LPS-assembly lipoprotein LptE [Candidatus Profftia lariciata]